MTTQLEDLSPANGSEAGTAPSPPSDMKVWIDGAVVDAADAKVPVIDHGLLYGDGIFEGMRIFGGGVFRLDDHMRRFESASRALAIDLPGGIEAIRGIVLETARAYGAPNAYLRLVATRGDALGVDPTQCGAPRVFCIAAQLTIFPAEKRARGIDLITSSLRRPPADVLDPRVKSLNYLNTVLAKHEARLRGADEAILLNQAGMVSEASVANVFAMRRGCLVTPPVTDGALEGITRMSVLDIAKRAGIETAEKSLGRFDLFDADEVFLTGSGAGIVPVGSLDGRKIGRTRDLTDRLTKEFERFGRENSTAF